MSFSLKKNQDTTFIFKNSATSFPVVDKWSENGTSIFNNNTGNVGINISNPMFNLDVSGTTNITGNLTVDTNALIVNTTNNRIGINTSNPSYTFDISGDLRVNTLYYTNLSPSPYNNNYAAIYASGTNQVIPDINSPPYQPVKIQFNNYTNNTNGVIINGWAYDPSSNQLTCPQSGIYLINFQLAMKGDASVTSASSDIRIYSIPALGGGFIPVNANSYSGIDTITTTNSWSYSLSAGDQIYVAAAYTNPVSGTYTVDSASLLITPL